MDSQEFPSIKTPEFIISVELVLCVPMVPTIHLGILCPTEV